jgi:hypothetical protein
MSRLPLYLLGSTFLFALWGHVGSAAHMVKDWPATSVPMLRSAVPVRDSDVLMSRGSVHCAVSAPSSDPSDPATTSSLPRKPQFVVRDHFREDTSPQAEVSIAWLGAMFKARLLNKIEANDDGETTLRAFVLSEEADNAEIMKELEGQHETQLNDLWCLLTRQPDGEPGALLTDAAANIFYIRDMHGDFYAVDVVWGGAGWEIGASAIIGPHHWPAGQQLISR